MNRKTVAAIVVILSIAALWIWNQMLGLPGSDDKVKDVFASLRPGYQPWAKPFGFIPSHKVEAWLFVGQIVAGLLVFFICFLLLKKLSKTKASS